MPPNRAAAFGGRYRRIPGSLALVLAAVISLPGALTIGLLAAWTAMYFYEGGSSKGDDAGVALGGFFALGIFTFVVIFTWLQKVHHPTSSRSPSYAMFACLMVPAAITLVVLSEIDGDHLLFLLAGWVVIALARFVAWTVCRHCYERSELTL